MIGLSIILIGLGLIILPTFTPEDIVTTVPLFLFLPPEIFVYSMFLGVVFLISGVILKMRGL